MSPYPEDPVRARGPMRIVLSAYPDRASAAAAAEAALAQRLAACVQLIPIESRYWWRGQVERSDEVLALFKTVPKRVGALLERLRASHPYEVPELAEIDVPRAGAEYLTYLGETLDPDGLPGGGPAGATHRGAPRGRGARALGRTRAPHRPRSR